MNNYRVFFMLEGLPGTYSLPMNGEGEGDAKSRVLRLLASWYSERLALVMAVEPELKFAHGQASVEDAQLRLPIWKRDRREDWIAR